MEKTNGENEAIKKRDDMIAKNLELAKQNEYTLRENSLESILVENKQYIMQAKLNKRYINFNKNKVLENLLQDLKDRWIMENQEYEIENQISENTIENQTDVTIGEDYCNFQEETIGEQTLTEETKSLQENEETENSEFCSEATMPSRNALQEENVTENETEDLEKEQLEDHQLELKNEPVLENKETPIGVYAKYDENGNVKEVNSDIFIDDLSGWTKIDEGFGDRFAHAQSQYFEPNIDK